jgi:uncharacterized protein YndB with AHSA1/START domain
MTRPEATKDDYQPGRAGDAEIRRDGDRWTLVFVRELSHPPAKVWSALTDPANLSEWAPFDADRDLGSTGPVMLTMVGGTTDEPLESEVRHADAPHLLEYTWGDAVVRWELAPIESGTRLTLRQTLEDPTWLPKVAAGWHMCLDVAERAIAGHPIGRIVAGEAKRFGWERLNAEYAERFGVENTGWPSAIVRDEP